MGNTTEKPTDAKFSHLYLSGARIGSGTFAVVKKCKRKKDGRDFAVKIIDKRHLTGRELVGLKYEIKILQTMQHRNVMQAVDVFEDRKRVKIILELCEGGDLFDQMLEMPHKRLDEQRSAHICAVVAIALKHLHTHSVVHRDLKPENILFTKDGIIKLTDFGLAHYLKLPPDFHLMHTCCGTPHYVAPEVLGTDEYSVQVDFWSLGVILYIMLSGYQPFNSKSIRAMYGLIIRGQYHFPKPHWDHVSESAIVCVKALMNVDPKKRYDCEGVLGDPWIRSQVDVDALKLECGKPVKMESALDQISESELKSLGVGSSSSADGTSAMAVSATSDDSADESDYRKSGADAATDVTATDEEMKVSTAKPPVSSGDASMKSG